MKNILNLLGHAHSFAAIAANLHHRITEQWVRNTKASTPALLAAYLHQKNKRSCLLITQTQEDAEELFDDTCIFNHSENVVLYPALETLPYDKQKPNDANLALRTEALNRLLNEKQLIIVVPIRALLQKIPTPQKFKSSTIEIALHDTLDMEILLETLIDIGFVRSGMVERIGEFSLRGGILDIYSYGNENPVRIEFFGEEVDSIREFDIVTQRSLHTIDTIKILPRQESQTKTDATLFSYLNPDTILILDHPQELKRIAGAISDEVEMLYQEALAKDGDDIPLPHQIYENYHGFDQSSSEYQLIYLDAPGRHKTTLEIELPIQAQEPLNGNLELLRDKLTELKEAAYQILIYCDNQGQADRMAEILEEWEGKISILVGTLHRGFIYSEARLAIFADREIFNRYRRRRHRRRFKTGQAITELNTMNEGDYVVHVNYGIGIYWGIKRIAIDDHLTDCLEIAYQDNDKLYVPIEQIKYVHKYSIGDDGNPPSLTKLGGTAWEKVKARTKKGIMDMADDLVKLYAERQAKRGHAFSVDTPWQRELEASFIYEETPDQIETIWDVKNDMEKSAPMDRLICGDVGYGKTEVAIRAAFKAVLDGRQVAVLVPTTILAQQHWITFQERLADFPVVIEMLSRFRTQKEIKLVIGRLKEGTVDIVIGTHRLIQKDIEFKNLGLVIVDEEQRFGVTHKEHLKKLRKQVDVLTMTATPIPRTLHFSLMGARDMSIINTAPQGRLPIRTEVVPFSDDVIADSILREVDRGGQVYFLHNRVQSIDGMVEYLRKVVPQVRFGVAHGQMSGHQLEKAMVDFLDHRFDVLVCTTIIENGVDIPNVNTIIINRADRFGLAQLYQLRGRVGRSTRLAYAYLLTSSRHVITPIARQRLQAIEEYSELGSGLKIALRDLEIRGAGNLLGAQQSGYVEEVGFDLYCDLVAEAVHEVKGDVPETAQIEPDIRIAIDVYIPDDYILETRQKILFYKRLSAAKELAEVEELRVELKDRYGKIPEPAELLIDTIEIRVLAATLWIPVVKIKEGMIYYEFSPEKMPNPQKFANIAAYLTEKKLEFHFEATEPMALRIMYGDLSDVEILEAAKGALLKLQ